MSEKARLNISWAGIGSPGAAIFIFALAKWREGGQGEAAEGETLLMLVASSLLTGLNMFIPKVLTHVHPGGTIFSMLPYTGGAVLFLFAGYMVVASSTAMVFVYYSLKSLAGAVVYRSGRLPPVPHKASRWQRSAQ